MTDDICIYCGGPKAVRNPTGNCDHLYWPDMIPAAKDAERERGLAAARSGALEEAAKVALSTGSGPYSSTAGWALSERIAAAIRELKDK